MSGLSKEQKEKIDAALGAKGITIRCPACQHQEFKKMDGYFNRTVQADLSGVAFGGGPTFPSVVAYCQHCGFMMQFALGPLGLLPKE